jgi:hypothetical protein
VQLSPQHSPQCLLIYWTPAQIFPQRQINKRLITHPLFFRSRPEGLKHIITQHDSDARLSGPQSIKEEKMKKEAGYADKQCGGCP